MARYLVQIIYKDGRSEFRSYKRLPDANSDYIKEEEDVKDKLLFNKIAQQSKKVAA